MKNLARTITPGRLFVCTMLGFLAAAGCAAVQKYNVVEKTDLSINYNRRDEERWVKPYYEFPDKHEKYRTIISKDEFMDHVLAACKKEDEEPARPRPLTVSREQLKAFVLDGLNIRFMVEGICKRGLIVTTISKKGYPEYTEKVMLFDDEDVGTFAMMLLMPKKKKPVPAIIGLHGHGDNFEMFANDFMGRELAQNGFAVIMPNLRAMNVNKVEFDVGMYLATNGFNLMGMRLYETLLLMKYLHYLDAVDNRNIGIIGHSGGSSTANLVVRISDDISAQITDWDHSYIGLANRTTGVHCETIPAVHPFEQLINDLRTLPFPVMHVPYGFEEQKLRGRILDFFKEHLQ